MTRRAAKDQFIGKQFRTRYEHSENVKVLRKASSLPEGWYVVRYLENHPGKCCMHRDMLALSNQ